MLRAYFIIQEDEPSKLCLVLPKKNYQYLFQETFRSCADIAVSGKVPNTSLKKMEKLQKLYLLLKKREKVKLAINVNTFIERPLH